MTMRIGPDGSLACGFCGEIVGSFEGVLGVPFTFQSLSATTDEAGKPYIAVEYTDGRELRHDCTQIPEAVLAALGDEVSR